MLFGKASTTLRTRSWLALAARGVAEAPSTDDSKLETPMVRKNWLQALLVFMALLMATASQMAWAQEKDVCWKSTYGRGVGEVPDSCRPGLERNGALCYEQCRPGFLGNGPVCWGSCPAGMQDMGAFCAKPEPSYGRTAGYVDLAQCRREHAQGCEQDGLLQYPRCKAGYTGRGPVCWSTQACPAGFAEAGLTCTKPSYGRGAGEPLVCSAGKQADAGLCYQGCRPGFDGAGPVCWGRCQGEYGFECGGLCAIDQAMCVKATADMVIASLETIGTLVGTVVTGGAAGAAKAAASTAARIATRGIAKEAAKAAIRDAARKAGQSYTEMQLENMALASVGQDFDPTMLDPTGIASLVKAFNKPICNEPGASTANTRRPIDMLTVLTADRFQFVDWNGRQLNAGRSGNNFTVGAGTQPGGESNALRYVAADGQRWVAFLTPDGFIHQPGADEGKQVNGRLVNSHQDWYMEYRGWDGGLYRASWGALVKKWQVTRR